jgi:CRP-like cAMP-binding protein
MVNSAIKPTIDLLKEIKLLKSFSDSELQHLIQLGTSASYEPHTNVIIEGELSWGLYLILDGTVGILKMNKLTSNAYDVGQLRSGNFFGEMSLIDENPRSATIRTLTNTELFYISKDTFIEFLDRSPDLKLRFYTNCVSNLVVRLRELDDNYVISQYQLWQSALKKEETPT